jgi:RHS repeat-associated protein
MTHKTQEGMLSSFSYEYDANGNRTKAVETQQKATAAPAVFSVARQDFTSVSLTWPKDAAASGYHLYRSSDNKANWTQIAGLSSTTTRYIDFGLPRETPLWYRLSPWDGSGEKQPGELSMETGFAPSIEPEFVSATIEYTYDALSRLKEANYADGNYFRYAYDANGNRLSETTPAGTVASVYDAANRLVSVGGVTYTWDDNGNLLSDGVNTYTYDHANRLTSVTQGANVSTYAYNGDGDRVSQTVNGTTTNYTLDLNAGLTQVLADNTTTYLYGLNRIGQSTGTDSAYFLGDALGSVRQMADSTGAVTLSRSYDPYGNVVSSQGSGETEFGYTGEMQQGGLVYLRARYYATEDGRFLSRDTWEGNDNTPLSLNKWNYVEGNPVNRTDPSGYKQIVTPETVRIWDYDNLPWGPDGYLDPRDLPTAILFSYEYTELGIKVYQLPELRAYFNRNATQAYKGYYEVVKDYGTIENGFPRIRYFLTELEEMDTKAFQLKAWNWGKAGLSAVTDIIVAGKVVKVIKAGGGFLKVASSICMELIDPRIKSLKDIPGTLNSAIGIGETATSGEPIGDNARDIIFGSIPVFGTMNTTNDAVNYKYPFEFDGTQNEILYGEGHAIDGK